MVAVTFTRNEASLAPLSLPLLCKCQAHGIPLFIALVIALDSSTVLWKELLGRQSGESG